MDKRFLAVIFFPLLCFSAFSQNLTILTEDSGMANRVDENGNLVGYSTEVVREILRRHNRPDNIQVYPWARAYKRLEEEANIALFSTTLTAERKEKFKWVGPLILIEWALYKSSDSNLTLNSLEEAKQLKEIVVIQDDAKEQFLIDNGFTNINDVNRDISAIRMVHAGRADVWFSSNRGIVAAAGKAGYLPDEFGKALSIKKVYLYIAFSKETPDQIVSKWQSTLDEMKQDGTYRRIMIENGGQDVMATEE